MPWGPTSLIRRGLPVDSERASFLAHSSCGSNSSTPAADFQGLSYTIGQRACCNNRLIHKGFSMSGDRAPLYSGSIAKADSSRAAVSALDSPAEICLVSISVPPRAAEPSTPRLRR